MFWIIVGALVLGISDYVLTRLTMIYGKLTTRLMLANELCISPSKSKCLLLSRTKRAFDVPDIIIRRNKIDFVEQATTLGVIFNGRLMWSNRINVIVDKVYGMRRNLWAVIDSTPFAIHMQLAKTFLIPVLLYGSENF